MSEDHEVIYLEPECCADPDLGRTWCQDVPWDCVDGVHPTAYIRKDIHDAKVEQLKAAIREAIEDTQNCIDGEASLAAMEYLHEDLKSALEEPTRGG